jgi:hypothetical protein
VGLGLNSRLGAYKVGFLTTWATFPVHFALLIFEVSSPNYLSGLASNHNTPDLSLPSRQDCRHEPLVPGSLFRLFKVFSSEEQKPYNQKAKDQVQEIHIDYLRLFSVKNKRSLKNFLIYAGTLRHSTSLLAVSYRTKHTLVVRSSNHTPGYLPNELKTYAYTYTFVCGFFFMWIFIEALFIIAKTWKPPRCSSIGEWINCSL